MIEEATKAIAVRRKRNCLCSQSKAILATARPRFPRLHPRLGDQLRLESRFGIL